MGVIYATFVPQEAQRGLDLTLRSLLAGRKPLLYLGAHIAGYGTGEDERQRTKNAGIASELSTHFAVFLPQLHNPYGFLKARSQGFEMALADFFVISQCDAALFVAPFGKDTSCEAGFALASGKHSALLLPDKESFEQHSRDWMVANTFSQIIAPREVLEQLPSMPAFPPHAKRTELNGANLGQLVYEQYLRTAASSNPQGS